MTFEQALREQLTATPDLRRRGKKILAILNARPSRKRERQIHRMRKHVEAEIPYEVDYDEWDEIDWPTLLESILRLLLLLLPLLI